MKRAFLKKGDVSDCGGVVVEGLDTMFHNGTAITFLGAKVACPVCKTIGVIIGEGPRFDLDNLTGRRMALDKDRCGCKCSPLPYMIASQSTMTISVAAGQDTPTESAPLTAEQAKSAPHWIAFHANDVGSLEGLKCEAAFDDGSTMNGTFDRENKVHFARENDSVCTGMKLAAAKPATSQSVFSAFREIIEG